MFRSISKTYLRPGLGERIASLTRDSAHGGLLGSRKNDVAIRYILFVAALISVLVLTAILVFLFMEGIPILGKVSIWRFLFGHEWYPTSDPPSFGVFPLLIASVAVTVVSTLFSAPLGIMTAIYMAELASPKVRNIIKPTVELLAALPSVVIGFFGMVVVAPFLQDVFDLPTDSIS